MLKLPEVLTSEKYLTLATWGLVFCTFLLFIATVVLWIDSWVKGKEQRSRWNREDFRYEESRKPKYRFGLKVLDHSTSVCLWIANFGATGLYIERLFVKHRDRAKGELAIDRLVASGEQLEILLPDTFWQYIPGTIKSREGNFLYGDHEVWLAIKDSDSEFESDRFLYNFLYRSNRFHQLRRGNYENRQPICPKCKQTLNFVLPASGFLTESEVDWRDVIDDLEESCPNHSSTRLKSIVG